MVRGSATTLNVRLVLKTDDGVLIGITHRGVRHGPSDLITRLEKGEAVDPAGYYFRIAARFEAASGKYQWLNDILAIGTATGSPAVRSTVFSKSFDRG